jgi:nicotinate phosphoribosyltransferase
MQNAICTLYPKIKAEYTFNCRDNREFPDGFAEKLKGIIDRFRGITLTDDEYDFLREKCYYLNPVYLDFLRGYRYDPSEVFIEQIGPRLNLKIRGDWYRTVLWETVLMATISELYFEKTHNVKAKDLAENGIYYSEFGTRLNRQATRIKAKDLAENGIYYSEFGTRRRYSFENQDMAIQDLKKYGQGHMLGTSNVYLAMKHNLTPLGTVAHEFFAAHAAMFGYTLANKMANEAWITVYQGDLGTALPDTFTTDVFLQTFSTKYAKLFDGIRQDSGQPLVFLDKVVNHYKSLRINPMHKYIMFSDNLKSIEQIVEIHKACEGKIPDRYGIGTWLSNDVAGAIPLNMVIKLTACFFDGRWIPTVKLSDDPGKNIGDPAEVLLCKQILRIA